MKKYFVFIALFALLMAGCGTNTEKGTPVDEVAEQEISELDSLTNEIEELKADIEESAEKLDELIDEL